MVLQQQVFKLAVDCFRPLTGMVRTIENGPKKRSRFRPLAGMVHDGYVVGTGNYGFRPLTGIICETAYHEVGHLFPPPYGDHIFCIY